MAVVRIGPVFVGKDRPLVFHGVENDEDVDRTKLLVLVRGIDMCVSRHGIDGFAGESGRGRTAAVVVVPVAKLLVAVAINGGSELLILRVERPGRFCPAAVVF
jgi:hypothetical protein